MPCATSTCTFAKVDISLLLMPKEQDESSPPPLSRSSSVPAPTTLAPSSSQSSVATKRGQPAHASESPAKKQSKWSAEEDALIIELRGGGMKWEDISKNLKGRSAISCRLHYQNYLERKSDWDEERKNKLARLYERQALLPIQRGRVISNIVLTKDRFKPEMWSKIAEEMAIPWRAAEAMHWQLGEQDMARRAGVVPFSLSSSAIETPPKRRRGSAASSRSRRESVTRSGPPQLPSVGELTAGMPAYVTPFTRPQETKGGSSPGPYAESSKQKK
ncbi:MAG: hypothetical protein M1830_002834 [Pleopsidium flavum]|nr:MAG: hypothetical protein M1830_002834 [Pleopsidium flavum]